MVLLIWGWGIVHGEGGRGYNTYWQISRHIVRWKVGVWVCEGTWCWRISTLRPIPREVLAGRWSGAESRRSSWCIAYSLVGWTSVRGWNSIPRAGQYSGVLRSRWWKRSLKRLSGEGAAWGTSVLLGWMHDEPSLRQVSDNRDMLYRREN